MRLALLLMALAVAAGAGAPAVSDERLVLQTTLGDIELAFFPEVAPVTVAHMLELGRLGAFTTNHFFRVDRGFVAQARRWSRGRGATGFGVGAAPDAQRRARAGGGRGWGAQRAADGDAGTRLCAAQRHG